MNHAPSAPLPMSQSLLSLYEKIEALVVRIGSFESQDRTWVDIKNAVHRFGVPAKTIKAWAANGFVRKAKLGPTFQSKMVYFAEDINHVLLRSSEGKPPVSALRKAT